MNVLAVVEKRMFEKPVYIARAPNTGTGINSGPLRYYYTCCRKIVVDVE